MNLPESLEMTDRERAFADAGFDYCEGIERAESVEVPSTGRVIRKTVSGWTAQPWDDNYWREFGDLLDALRFATRPKEAIR